MRRIFFISLAALAVLLFGLAGTAAWLLNDEAFLKRQFNGLSLKHTGRELRIAGPLEIDFGREIRISAAGITFENPSWAENPDMVRIGSLDTTLLLNSLFSGQPRVPELTLQDCAVELLKNADGLANWEFPGIPAGEPEPGKDDRREGPVLPFALEEISIERCTLLVDGPERATALELTIDRSSLSRGVHGRVVSDMAGSLNGEALAVEGWLEPVHALARGGELRFDLEAKAGEIGLDTEGTIADARTFSGPDVFGRFHGPDIATVIETLALPPVSEGPFDFQVRLSTEESRARIDVDGDLGSLDVKADGILDQLSGPGSGGVNVDLDGPDLGALAEAFELSGIVNEPFEASLALAFSADAVEIKQGSLDTSGNHLEFAGLVSAAEYLAGSELELRFESGEIGRWASLIGKPETPLGAASLDGSLSIEDGGIVHVDARASHGQSELAARGIAASLDGRQEPDLDFEFRSSDMPRLAGLVGYEGFPGRPFSLSGNLKKQGMRLGLTDLELSLNRSSAAASGALVLDKEFSGSEIAADIDIPDAREFGLLFGMDDLLPERIQARLTAKLENRGLWFEISDGSFGNMKLDLEGRIPDLGKPAALDANFDLRLPGLKFIRIWLPGLALPEGAFTARGHLVNRNNRVDINGVALSLGETTASVEGFFTPEKDFDIRVDAGGPDASQLNEWLGSDLPAEAFGFSGRLEGKPSAFRVEGLEASLGESSMTGDLALELGESKKVSGSLHSALLDLDWIETGEPETPREEKQTPSAFVFDDTPVREVTDIGVVIDGSIEIDELRLMGARYQDFRLGVQLAPRRLHLKPFAFNGFLSGSLSGEFLLVSGGERPRLEARFNTTGLKSGLLAAEGQDPASLPKMDIQIDLQGSGRTHRELVAGMNGRIRARAGSGELARSGFQFLTNDFVTQLLNTLNPFADRSDYTQLDCGVAAADIVDGQLTLNPLVVHIRELTIISDGRIDLATERLNIAFNTKLRRGLGISAGDLVNPFIRVGGTLAQPALALDTTGTVVQGGLAIATGGLSILANSLSKRYLSSRDPCGDAIREIEKRDSG